MRQPLDLQDHVLKRAATQLGRFAHEITSVLVRIRDVNGPKGGLDKQCVVTVRGHRIPNVVVDDAGGDPYATVNSAMQRVGRIIARDVARLRRGRAPVVLSRSAS